MKGPIFACVLATVPTVSLAEEPLPPYPKGFRNVLVQECVDLSTNEEGVCTQSDDAEGNIYIVFSQNGLIMSIRLLLEKPPYYSNLWVRDTYAVDYQY